jgi:nucleotide-binding universal stress UspA family protein
MGPFSKLLIPIDFSERDVVAARFAIPFAKRFRSEITLIHVDVLPGSERKGFKAEQMPAPDGLDAAFNGLAAKRVLRFGDPAEEIASYARANHIDLIMMVTRGYGSFRRLFVGSVTAKVLNHADCAVWAGDQVTDAPPAGGNSPKTILCAVDADQEGKCVFAWSAELASKINAALILVHVEPRFISRGEDFYSTSSYHRIIREANQKMEQLQKAAITHAPIIIESGRIPEALGRTATRVHADLIVAGRGSPSPQGRLGMNIYEIVRETGCPVISVSAKRAASNGFSACLTTEFGAEIGASGERAFHA